MAVEIKKAKGQGDLDEERLVLDVRSDDDVGFYVVFDTTFNDDGGVSNRLRHAYWFPDKEVLAGDLVVLYTKRGRAKEKLNPDGSKTHFFYWGLGETVWNEQKDCAVLLRARNWEAQEAVTPGGTGT